jgi:hypothetical protein
VGSEPRPVERVAADLGLFPQRDRGRVLEHSTCPPWWGWEPESSGRGRHPQPAKRPAYVGIHNASDVLAGGTPPAWLCPELVP